MSSFKVHQYASTAALLSGNWNNGSQAGAFYLNLNNAASNRNYNISGRAQYVHYTRKLKQCYVRTLCLATWQNTKTTTGFSSRFQTEKEAF